MASGLELLRTIARSDPIHRVGLDPINGVTTSKGAQSAKLLGPFDRPSMTLFRENLVEHSNIAAEIHVWGEPHFCALPLRG